MTLTHAYEEMTLTNARKTSIWMGLAFGSKRWIMAVNIPIQCSKLKLTDAQGRSCIYVPITQNGKVVNR